MVWRVAVAGGRFSPLELTCQRGRGEGVGTSLASEGYEGEEAVELQVVVGGIGGEGLEEPRQPLQPQKLTSPRLCSISRRRQHIIMIRNPFFFQNKTKKSGPPLVGLGLGTALQDV